MTGAVVTLERVSKQYTVHAPGRDTLRGALAPARRREPSRSRWALREVSLTVERGESVAIVGHNGAGKSTLLRLVTGVERPTSGRLRVTGRVAAILGLGVGFSDDLTGREKLDVAGGLLGLRRGELDAAMASIADFSGVGPELHRPLREYSSGMVARLGFALATHVPADVLVVDEALSVGDEEFRARCIDRIDRFRRDGGTLLFASHERELVERLAGRTVHLRTGVAQGG